MPLHVVWSAYVAPSLPNHCIAVPCTAGLYRGVRANTEQTCLVWLPFLVPGCDGSTSFFLIAASILSMYVARSAGRFGTLWSRPPASIGGSGSGICGRHIHLGCLPGERICRRSRNVWATLGFEPPNATWTLAGCRRHGTRGVCPDSRWCPLGGVVHGPRSGDGRTIKPGHRGRRPGR
jgi:hypothetical protein